MEPFVHLHNHTIYSVRDSLLKPKVMIEKCLEYNMNSIAVTEHGTMSSHYELFKLGKQNNIKIIYGLEAYIAPEKLDSKEFHPLFEDKKRYNFHIVLLAKNKKGYQNLKQLNYISYKYGFYRKPRVDFEILKKYNEGLICMSACIGGYPQSLILIGKNNEADNIIEKFIDIFGDDYYLEIQRHGLEEQDIVTQRFNEIKNKFNRKLVLTNDIHYSTRDAGIAHAVLMAKQFKVTLDEYRLKNRRTQEEFFKSSSLMYDLFTDKEPYNNAIEISKQIEEIDIRKDEENTKFYFPIFDISKSNIKTISKLRSY